jgi:hypothetical protein
MLLPSSKQGNLLKKLWVNNLLVGSLLKYVFFIIYIHYIEPVLAAAPVLKPLKSADEELTGFSDIFPRKLC